VKKILIVEDEIGIVQFLKEGLEEEGFEVEYANDGVAGLKLATEKTLICFYWIDDAKNDRFGAL
jgi:DNA-binding response OmpR family regulator